MFVLTFKEKGGLQHLIFLFLFLFASPLLIFRSLGLLYENISVKPLLFNGFSNVSFALLKTFSSQEMSYIHFVIDFGSSLKYWVDDLIVYEYKLVRCLVYKKVGKYYFLSIIIYYLFSFFSK